MKIGEKRFKSTKAATKLVEDVRYERIRFNNFIENRYAKVVKCSNCGCKKILYTHFGTEPDWVNDFVECPDCKELEVFKTLKTYSGREIIGLRA